MKTYEIYTKIFKICIYPLTLLRNVKNVQNVVAYFHLDKLEHHN